jgi:hypothetical protein
MTRQIRVMTDAGILVMGHPVLRRLPCSGKSPREL